MSLLGSVKTHLSASQRYVRFKSKHRLGAALIIICGLDATILHTRSRKPIDEPFPYTSSTSCSNFKILFSYGKGQETAFYCKAMKVATFQHLRARNVGLLGEYLFASSNTLSDFGLGRDKPW